MKVELRRRARHDDDPGGLHARFLKVMGEVGSPWWNGNAEIAGVSFEGKLECQVGLSRGLPGDAVGSLAYVHRGADYLKDQALFDDRFVATFYLDDAGYRALVDTGFEHLVRAFGPYRGQIILDEDLALDDWDAAVARGGSTAKDEDGRDGMHRMWPVVFLDDQLCRRALGIPPGTVADRLKGEVERTNLLHGGILVIASSDLLSVDTLVATDQRIRQRLSIAELPPVELVPKSKK